ncbi:MAG: valine--tRNA ligase [Candidatus Kaelpia imicola]|nr:valine--tRNA ligase [Candidatus Kaelpia imicola]
MESRYNSKEIEQRWYKFWESNGLFRASVDSKKKPYSIVIPPPNITGILHMGHALNNTIQDILIRYKRMQGYASLWIPGTDHAGIATQNVVEKQLAKEDLSRDDLGRESFIERVWKWREEYGSTIVRQLRRLGASCDWSRERFTMDEGLSSAVIEAFIKLYEKDFIYRGNYIINWCPRCKTALSDEEVEYQEQEGFLYYLKYPVLGEEGKFVTVATTRPETMLGDVAIAVHPSDERFEFLKDKKVVLPILNRQLKLIWDDIVDPEFGTGAVKITPAHDGNDFEIAMRHGLKPVVVMDEGGVMNENAAEYRGMDRFIAREKIVEDLEKQDLVEKIEPYVNSIGCCYRCGTVIEPYISWQWFVKMQPLAKEAIKVVKDREVKFFPPRWEKVYLHWMENIRDWCISRQIWWGHRIPVYYCRDCYRQTEVLGSLDSKSGENIKGIIVSRDKPDSCPECGGRDIYQDEDVLDTWFSSWLWPFSTMGWPNTVKSKQQAGKSQSLGDLDYFYPTSTLVTAQEILFFWVARMIMAGLEFIDQIPFSDVYIHGTVRDEKGRKMSKSLGNVIDPLEIIDEYGADALRFSLISITAMGQDVFLSKDRFIFGRNFTNKIWNAARFLTMNINEIKSVSPYKEGSIFDSWILAKLRNLIQELNVSLDKYNFNEAAFLLYEFFWHVFCDWYIELKKKDLYSEENGVQDSASLILIFVLDNLLRLLHPFMPFITEEIWQMLRPNLKYAYEFLGFNYNDTESLMLNSWPDMPDRFKNEEAESRMSSIIAIIQTVRNMRAELNVPSQEKIELVLFSSDLELLETFKKNISYLGPLAQISDIKIEREEIERPPYSAFGIIGETNIYILLEGIIDFERERERLSKKREKMIKNLEIAKNKLKNKDFINKANESVVQKVKERDQMLGLKIAEISDIIDNI